jgi:hypothetical protein
MAKIRGFQKKMQLSEVVDTMLLLRELKAMQIELARMRSHFAQDDDATIDADFETVRPRHERKPDNKQKSSGNAWTWKGFLWRLLIAGPSIFDRTPAQQSRPANGNRTLRRPVARAIAFGGQLHTLN